MGREETRGGDSEGTLRERERERERESAKENIVSRVRTRYNIYKSYVPHEREREIVFQKNYLENNL